ncbi:MAG: hypothetical protein GX444_04875 [Myxococcales bacterium]|nr:hypothetical protein [Myxococcales bacterium]
MIGNPPRTRLPREAAFRRSLRRNILLLGLIVLSLLWRGYLVFHLSYNPDEFFSAGGAARLQQRQLPLLDYPEGNPPLFYGVFSLAYHFLPLDERLLDRLRIINWFVVVFWYLLFFRLARRLWNDEVAFWSLGLLSCFVFITWRTVLFRPDSFGFLLLWLSFLVLLNDRRPSRLRLFLAAGLQGLAAMAYLPLAFAIPATALWLFRRRDGRWEWAAAGRAGFLFFFGAAVGALVSYGIILRSRTFAGLSAQLADFRFDSVYQQSLTVDTREIFLQVLFGNPLAWLLVLAAFAAALYARVRGRDDDPFLLFFLLQFATSLAVFPLRRHVYEQHYFGPAVYGSVLAGVGLAKAFRFWQKSVHPARVLFAAPVVAVLLAATALAGTWREFDGWRKLDAQATAARAEDRKTAAAQGDRFTVEQARDLLARRANAFHPFYYFSRTARQAQLRFILAHSRPDHFVLTDWYTPPFGRLPVGQHHGLLIGIIYRLPNTAADPALLALIRRYDPTYDPADPDEAAHYLRLFASRPPRVILLEGSLARLFVEAEPFRAWLGARYQFIYEPESGSLFALAAANPA